MSTAAGTGFDGKVPLQDGAALGVDAEQPPVGKFVTRLGAREALQDPGAQFVPGTPRNRLAQPEPPPPCMPPRVSAAGSSSRLSSSSARPDISSATSNTGRPSA